MRKIAVSKRTLLALLCVLALSTGCGTSSPAQDSMAARRLIGAINPDVTPANTSTTICKPGWTAMVRPPPTYTQPLKRRLWLQAGSPGRITDYELDHIVPLEVGGAPRDPANLTLQPWNGPLGAREKDAVENRVHREVCDGFVALRAAQGCFRTDWRRCP